MNNIKSKYIILVFLFFALLLFFGQMYFSIVGEKNFTKFNNANIDGHLTSIRILHRGCGIKVSGDTNTYVFHPFTNKELNDGHIFDAFAEKGDKVIKPPYADTLFLIKDKKVYKYIFDKTY